MGGADEQHEAQRSCKAQLEADVPEDVGVCESHEEGGRAEAGGGEGRPSQELGSDDEQSAHDRRADHRSFCADQQSVQNDTRQGRPGGGAAIKEEATALQKQAGNDGDVEAGDGNDVAHAGGLESVFKGGRQAVIIAQEDAAEQGGLGAGQHLVDGCLGAAAHGRQGQQEGVPPAALQKLDLRELHQAVDVLVGQVSLVVKLVGERSRLIQIAGQAHRGPVRLEREARRAHENQPLDGPGPGGGLDLLRGHGEQLVGVMDLWMAADPAGDVQPLWCRCRRRCGLRHGLAGGGRSGRRRSRRQRWSRGRRQRPFACATERPTARARAPISRRRGSSSGYVAASQMPANQPALQKTIVTPLRSPGR